MKKPKSLETKLKAAIRLIWSRSKEHRDMKKELLGGLKEHTCPLCLKTYPDWGFELDHNPAIGPLESWKDTVTLIDKMFWGNQRLLCKTCNRKLGALARRKAK